MPGGACPRALLVGGEHEPGRLDLSAEVGRIELLLEHGLVDLAEFRQREGPAEEGVGDVAVLELVPQTPEGVLDDLLVVEREGRKGVGRKPAHVLAEQRPFGLLRGDEGPIHDRDDALIGGAVEVAERVQLLQVARPERRGRLECRGCGVGQGLRSSEGAARKRPASVVRLADTTDEWEPDGRRRVGRAEGVVGPEGEDHGRDGEPDLRDVDVVRDWHGGHGAELLG